MDIIDTLPTRTATTNGAELDAIEHADVFGYGPGERKAVKRAINRRFRRANRQMIRKAY
jgi:hypothetical protein